MFVVAVSHGLRASELISLKKKHFSESAEGVLLTIQRLKGRENTVQRLLVAELISLVIRHHIHIVGFTAYFEELAEFYPQIEKEYVEKAAYRVLATLLFPEIVEHNHG